MRWSKEHQPKVRAKPTRGWKHKKLRSYGEAVCVGLGVVCGERFIRRTWNATLCPDCLQRKLRTHIALLAKGVRRHKK